MTVNMNHYAQMKRDFPTMYLRVMRNDAKVRCVAAGPAAEAFDKDVMGNSMSNFLSDFADLAEEAGLQEVADELNEAAAAVSPKTPRKSRAKV